MTPKSSSSIPHDHRLISRYEAAKLLGCTPQTIANWIEKGILNGQPLYKWLGKMVTMCTKMWSVSFIV